MRKTDGVTLCVQKVVNKMTTPGESYCEVNLIKLAQKLLPVLISDL